MYYYLSYTIYTKLALCKESRLWPMIHKHCWRFPKLDLLAASGAGCGLVPGMCGHMLALRFAESASRERRVRGQEHRELIFAKCQQPASRGSFTWVTRQFVQKAEPRSTTSRTSCSWVWQP